MSNLFGRFAQVVDPVDRGRIRKTFVLWPSDEKHRSGHVLGKKVRDPTVVVNMLHDSPLACFQELECSIREAPVIEENFRKIVAETVANEPVLGRLASRLWSAG